MGPIKWVTFLLLQNLPFYSWIALLTPRPLRPIADVLTKSKNNKELSFTALFVLTRMQLLITAIILGRYLETLLQ
jgi:hypothetical protein